MVKLTWEKEEFWISPEAKEMIRTTLFTMPILKNKLFNIEVCGQNLTGTMIYLFECYKLMLLTLSTKSSSNEEYKEEIKELFNFKFDINKIEDLLENIRNNFGKFRYKLILKEKVKEDLEKIYKVVTLFQELSPKKKRDLMPNIENVIPGEIYEEEKEGWAE